MKCSSQGQKHETPYACLLLARMTNTGRGIIPPRKCNINNSCGEFERLRTLTTSLGNTHLAHLLIVFAIWPRTLASWSSFISHSLQNFILQRFWRETWISFRWVSNFHKSQTVERLLLRLLWKPLSIIPSKGEKTTSSQVLSSSIICINHNSLNYNLCNSCPNSQLSWTLPLMCSSSSIEKVKVEEEIISTMI